MTTPAQKAWLAARVVEAKELHEAGEISHRELLRVETDKTLSHFSGALKLLTGKRRTSEAVQWAKRGKP